MTKSLSFNSTQQSKLQSKKLKSKKKGPAKNLVMDAVIIKESAVLKTNAMNKRVNVNLLNKKKRWNNKKLIKKKLQSVKNAKLNHQLYCTKMSQSANNVY